MTEAAFSVKVQSWLRKQGCWVVKYHASAYTPKGVPDLVGCYRGHFLGIELKAGSKLSDWQRFQGAKIQRADGIWLKLEPADFPHKLIEILREVDDGC